MSKTTHHKKALQNAFLAAYRTCASVTKAAEAAKIERANHYQWLRSDFDYAAAFEACKEQATQVLEDEAVRRAHDGVDEPVFYQGTVCGTVRKYSDTLLIFLLKGLRPEKYREQWKGEISTAGEIPISGRIDLSGLSDEELTALRSLVGKARKS
jgi:hypothetical protein